MSGAVAALDRWLFAPEDAARLTWVRTALAVVLAVRLATGPFARLAGQPAAAHASSQAASASAAGTSWMKGVARATATSSRARLHQ